ncbi:MAG: hypothetical protein Q8M29_10885 [Bacteroidota bacterium]|nr:hypothetical protein [Bacteroidota bacterium]
MPLIEIPEPKIKSPKTEISTELKTLPSEESQVIVHGHFQSSHESHELIRIWRTTYLIPHDQYHKSRLLHFENITLYPEWTIIPLGSTYRFTLIFSGLPKGCKVFDLIEEIPQSGGFEIRDIARTKSDVYHFKFG